MFKLNHTAPEEASGKVKEAYGVFPAQVPVPLPLQMMSASPDLALLQSRIIKHYVDHEKLDHGFTASLRYILANVFGYDYCLKFNHMLLTRAAGMSEEQLAAMLRDPSNAPLDESQIPLLLLAVKTARSPEKVSVGEVDKVRALGWDDTTIFDACYHAASFIAAATMWKALGGE